MVEALSDPELQGFDGELAIGAPTNPALCRLTTSYVNSYAQNTVARLPNWYIFDWLTPQLLQVPYAKRLILLKQRIKDLHAKDPERYGFLRIIQREHLCNSVEDVLAAHEEYITAGYEGTVTRFLAAPHKSGRSTVNQSWFMRLKDAGTEECTILDILEAQENLNPAMLNELGETERSSHKEGKISKNMIGSLIVEIPDGRVITIGAGKLTHEERYKYWEQPGDIIGRICTYKFMKVGEHEMRRHPRFTEFRDEDL